MDSVSMEECDGRRFWLEYRIIFVNVMRNKKVKRVV